MKQSNGKRIWARMFEYKHASVTLRVDLLTIELSALISLWNDRRGATLYFGVPFVAVTVDVF